MEYEVQREKGAVVVVLKEERVGYPGLEEFQKELHAIIEQGERLLIMDLSHVKFLDSFGIGVLAGLNRKLSSQDGHLRLCGVNKRITMALTITRLDRILQIFEDRAGALQSCSDDDRGAR